jgi:hypothetical protein
LNAEQTRRLVTRMLEVVQGHPKLIELADGIATNPSGLAARLDAANQTWVEHGAELETFLARGEADTNIKMEHYAAVLHSWTVTATTHLPEHTALLFQFLACLEPNDRQPIVVDRNWADLWKRLGRPDDPPDLADLFHPLIKQGLVETITSPTTGTVISYRIHPEIAQAARSTAEPDLTAAVNQTRRTQVSTIPSFVAEKYPKFGPEFEAGDQPALGLSERDRLRNLERLTVELQMENAYLKRAVPRDDIHSES